MINDGNADNEPDVDGNPDDNDDIGDYATAEEEDEDGDNEDIVTDDSGDQGGASSANGGASAVTVNNPTSACKRPELNSYIEYLMKDGNRGKALVLSKQPKRTGNSGDWLNVHVDGSDKPSSLNWKHVVEWKTLPCPEKVVFLTATQTLNQDVLDAKAKELDNLVRNDVFEVVPDVGQSRVSTKWVITEKFKNGKKIVKGRLVARGFEENLSKNTRTDSPTCSRQALRLCFVTASTMCWELHSLDVTSAFLQGNLIERDVFVQPPVEWDGIASIWKLKRCLYGLNDAPRAWYKRVEEELLKSGGKTSLYDEALFMWHDKNTNTLMGMIVSHVDDFVYCGSVVWHKKVIDSLFETFDIRETHCGSFKYIGLNVVQSSDAVVIDQQVYVDELQTIDIDTERAKQRSEERL